MQGRAGYRSTGDSPVLVVTFSVEFTGALTAPARLAEKKAS
jgi:hypothetical protein